VRVGLWATVRSSRASNDGNDVGPETKLTTAAGDFKPYVYKSTDRGRTWTSISGDLPARGSSYAVVEDTKDAKLLFAGTEYGLWMSQNGGINWVQLKGNFPTIAVRDLWIQKRRDDLVVATFGRGIYVLDDYRPLRTMSADVANREATLFPVRDADLYIERAQLGLPGKSFQGDSFFAAPNPPAGATFTYYLKDELRSRKKQRSETESKEIGNEPAKAPGYPTLEQLRAEERELDPAIVAIVADEEGNVVRRVTGPVKAGFHRIAWDLRYPPPSPIELKEPEPDVFSQPPPGPLAAPGSYTVRLSVNGTTYSQPLTLARNPIYPASNADLRAQLRLARSIAALSAQVTDAQHRAAALLKSRGSKLPARQLAALHMVIGAAPKNTPDDSVGKPATDFSSLRYIGDALQTLQGAVESAQAAPTASQYLTFRILQKKAASVIRTLQMLGR